MSTALAMITVLILCAGCIGYGGLLLACCRVDQHFGDTLERIAICFVLGLGAFGWLLFFPGVAGYLRSDVLWGVTILGVVALIFQLPRLRVVIHRSDFTPIEALLVVALIVVLVLDLLEGLSPPADADTLAYHFSLPRDFLTTGQVVFVPRAVSGAIPMLLHMSYAAALGIGGELTLTLWTMLTGWAVSLLLYALARRHMSRPWALILVLLFLTTPAVLYGGGNGQTEIRCAGFALACAALILMAERTGSLRIFLLAGLCAGFFIGAKYYGLIFAGAAGLVLIFNQRGLQRGLVFAAAAIFAGIQWYFWNWLHTGDPVFPMLTNLLQFPDSDYWTREFGIYFSKILAEGELPLERTLLNWISYPVLSIFNIVGPLEGGRTGIGIVTILILPVVIADLYMNVRQRREYVVLLAIAFIFFTVWFFSGTTQRTRHLLPIYPLLLMGLFPLAVAAAQRLSLVKPLVAGLAATLCIQLAGQSIFSVNYARYVFGSESRSQFLYRNVPGANGAVWINENLPETAKIGYMNRQLAYLIERKSYLLHPYIQIVVDVRPMANDERKFLMEVKRVGITHFLLSNAWQNPGMENDKQAPFFGMIGRLVDTGCLKQVQSFNTANIASRTLLNFGDGLIWSKDSVLAIMPARCRAIL